MCAQLLSPLHGHVIIIISPVMENDYPAVFSADADHLSLFICTPHGHVVPSPAPPLSV